MTRCLRVWPLLVLAAGIVLEAKGPSRTQRQTFRGQTDLVVLDVTVLRGTTPVTGLDPGAFRVTDNGIPQEAELVSPVSIPLDLSLVVAVGRLAGEDPMHFWDDVHGVARLLRPEDRLGLVTFGTAARVEFSLRPIPLELPPRPSWQRGEPVLYDAVLQAILRPSAPGRRHVILVMTHGVDVMSTSSPARVLEIAKRCDGLVFFVFRQVHPVPLDSLFDDIPAATGGGVLNESSLVRAVERILAGLQKGYVLAYTPRGVSPKGWHNISVSVTRPGDFTVRARRGYFAG